MASTAAGRRVPRERRASERTAVEVVQEWLWRTHSTSHALVLCVCIAVAVIDFCLVASLVIPLGQATSEDFATLNTLAQVAGGAFGTLITVVVFAVGLVSQRSDGSAMYTPFVARRHHVFVAAAAAAAICLVNAVGPLLGQWFDLAVVKCLLLTNAATMPAVILVTVWLMCRVIESASGGDFDSTLSVMRAAMRRIATYDRELTATAQHCLSTLDGSPVKFDVFAGRMSTSKARESRCLGKGVERLVTDVDLHCLQQIMDIARRNEAWVEVSLLALPTLIGDCRGVLHVSLRSEQGDTKFPRAGDDMDIAEPSKAPESLERALGLDGMAALETLADRLLMYGNRPETDSDLRQFFVHSQADLERVAGSGDSVVLKSRIENYCKLMGAWLEIAGPVVSPRQPRMFSYREPCFLGPLEIDLYEVLRAAAQSDQFGAYEAVVGGIVKLLRDADKHRSVGLYDDAANMLAFAQHLAMTKPSFRESARDLFDRQMDYIFLSRKSLRRVCEESDESQDGSQDSDEAIKRYSIIGAVLSMIRGAVEVGDEKTARYLFDRLMRQTSADSPQMPRGDSAPQSDTGETLIQYGRLVAIGWCYHMISQGHVQKSAAKNLMDYAIRSMSPRHYLIGLWELYHGSDTVRTDVDDRLRVARWELNEADRRTSFVYSMSGSGWVEDGFWIAMLLSEPPYEYQLRGYFQSAPSHWLWKTEGLDERIAKLQECIASDDTTDDRKAVRGEVIEFIKARERVGNAALLRRDLQSPLSEKKVSQFTADIVDGVSKSKMWPRAALQGSTSGRTAVTAPRTARGASEVHRNYLLENNNWGSGYGRWIVEGLVNREAVELVYCLEQSLSPGEVLFSLKRAGDAVREAVRELAAMGFKADLLIVPSQDRFANALFGRHWRHSEQGKRSEWGDLSVGEWEGGIHVVRCPYRNTTSVIVADQNALFGRIDTAIRQPTVELIDMTDAERQELLLKVTDSGTEPLPDGNVIKAIARAEVPPVVGIANVMAAFRIDVTKGDAHMVMAPESDTYHRVGCTMVERVEDLRTSLTGRLEGETKDRGPCPICRPDRWDFEAQTSGAAE